jgi:hypothetical protein
MLQKKKKNRKTNYEPNTNCYDLLHALSIYVPCREKKKKHQERRRDLESLCALAFLADCVACHFNL